MIMPSVAMRLCKAVVSFQPVLAVDQDTQRQADTRDSIGSATDKIFDKLIEWRKRFHEIPKLAGREQQTHELTEQYLSGLKIEVKTDMYGYGLAGILGGGKKGRKIAYRAEIGALPTFAADKADMSCAP